MLVNGFSKLSKEEKIDWLISNYFDNNSQVKQQIIKYWNDDKMLQKLHDDFIENTISNYYLPFGVAPNFIINGKTYVLPMVIEESSVVAAAANSAKYWSVRGGFHAEVLATEKVGQVHFQFTGNFEDLKQFVSGLQNDFISATAEISKNMQKRGGGILNIELKDKTKELENYYQLHCTFDTKDSMGANFINSCLEALAEVLREKSATYKIFTEKNNQLNVVMSILSNYVPNCVVRAWVSCSVNDLKSKEIENPQEFVQNFIQAVKIAAVEPFRAVTHNKGVMNGVDALVLATGNDFRAIEAGVHAYASKSGRYSSLSHAEITNGVFKFWIDLPLALGTVGGLTNLHPMVKVALQMLGNPSANELMQIIAVAGLAQNFAAVKSLTTTGIQQGHMKMHLMNILNQLQATGQEIEQVKAHFKGKTLTHNQVVAFVENLRK